ncbi:MAG: hypothetical protein AAF462_00905 [Thermodesulfobacteriota bacterium]
MRILIVSFISILIFSSCSIWDKPDVREAKWGMSKEEVKKVEKAELIKEGEDILTYRIGGEPVPLEIEQSDTIEYEGEEITPPKVSTIDHEYDLLYVFGEKGLGMVIVHLRDPLDSPQEYLEFFKIRTNMLTKEIGEPAKGVASYADHEVKANPYEDPAAICRGEHGLQHIWPTKDKKTNVSLELDSKKFSAEPQCTVSIFYESVDIPVDQELSDQLHDLL